MLTKQLLLFGDNGSIGKSILANLNKDKEVFHFGRDISDLKELLNSDIKLDGVIWAQGKNDNSKVEEFELNSFMEIFEANVIFILETSKLLVESKCLSNPCNFVVLGSVWSQIARENKMNYIVSKSALSGLVKSMAIDLAPYGIRVNAISPGPIENKMTRQMLNTSEINTIIAQTPLKSLCDIDTIVNLVTCFAKGDLLSITGQEIIIDGGWSIAKYF